MNKTLLAIVLSGATFVSALSPVAALAQEASPTPTVAPSASPSTKRPVENLKLKNCDALQNRIEGRIKHYRAVRDNYVAKYNRVVERSENVVDTLREKGYPEDLVATLETHLVELKGMIQDFGSDADAAIKKLEEANDFNCGDSEGEFRSRLEEARELLGVVRDDVASIRDFVKNTIKADIQALKNSNPNPSPSTEPTASPEAE